jgi:hypothetical protein
MNRNFNGVNFSPFRFNLLMRDPFISGDEW